ncbi:MAG: class I SAM-dependent methyltransferase [Chloroflexota bacterium]
MPLLDHFSLLAPFYERAIPLRSAEKIIAMIGLPVEGALLDAGGGTGRVTQALAGLAGLRVVADESGGMLAQAALKPGVLPAQAHTERLPFADGVFERVIMVDALHHVLHQHHSAAEMWRVLRPGGRIVIEEPDVRTFSVKLVALAEKLALMRSHFLSPPEIQALFPFPGARSRVELDGWNAWVIIEKPA